MAYEEAGQKPSPELGTGRGGWVVEEGRKLIRLDVILKTHLLIIGGSHRHTAGILTKE